MTHLDNNSGIAFNFEGQFLGFVHQDGRLKYLRLRTLSDDLQVKLPKAMRTAELPFQPGDWLRIAGIGKLDRHTHALKLKADHITRLSPSNSSESDSSELAMSANSITATPTTPEIKPTAKIKVLVCQKSGCLKRGGKGLGKALDQLLCDRHWQAYVTIKPTGCLKRCSAAPNLIIQPGNHRYSAVRPQSLPQIADAIAQHLVQH